MNKEALLEVADAIEGANRFDIGVSIGEQRSDTWWKQEPKTTNDLWDNPNLVGCVAAWTVAWACDDALPNGQIVGTTFPRLQAGGSWTDIDERATAELGLEKWQADRLFFASRCSAWEEVYPGLHPHGFTAKQAARVLRMVANGKVKCMLEE